MLRASVTDPVQVRLSGAGGQGLVTAGVILAEAGLLDGKYVVQTQSYGPEARLGSSRAEVILSTRPISHPQVTVPDALLCMSAESFERYAAQVHPHTLVVVDSTNVETGPATATGRLYPLPLTATAERAGNRVVANIIALWVMNTLAGLVSPENLRRAILKRVPQRYRTLNEQALEAAAELVAAATEPPAPVAAGGSPAGPSAGQSECQSTRSP